MLRRANSRAKLKKKSFSYVSHIHTSHKKHSVPDFVFMYVRGMQHFNSVDKNLNKKSKCSDNSQSSAKLKKSVLLLVVS